MGFPVPYRLRPYRTTPGVYTFRFVTWVLFGVGVVTVGAILSAVAYLVSIHQT